MFVSSPLTLVVAASWPLIFLLILTWLSITVGFLLLTRFVLSQHSVDGSFVNPRVEGLLAGIIHAFFVLQKRDTELLCLVHTPGIQETIITDSCRVLGTERHRQRFEHSVCEASRLASII